MVNETSRDKIWNKHATWKSQSRKSGSQIKPLELCRKQTIIRGCEESDGSGAVWRCADCTTGPLIPSQEDMQHTIFLFEEYLWRKRNFHLQVTKDFLKDSKYFFSHLDSQGGCVPHSLCSPSPKTIHHSPQTLSYSWT